MGDLFKYNDYELLYLARQNNQEGKNILIEKYSILVRSRMKLLNVPKSLYDDYLQEGLLMIEEAIKIYDTDSQMSFTNFLDMLIKRRFITLLRKDRKMIVVDDDYYENLIDNNEEDKTLQLAEDCYDFSPLERDVYYLYYIKKINVKTISIVLNQSSRTISNTKQRILYKIKRERNRKRSW